MTDVLEEYLKRKGELLIEMPERIVALKNINERLFATLESGQVIDVTELLGEAKH